MLLLGDAVIPVACVFDRRADIVAIDLYQLSVRIDPDIDILGICILGVGDGLHENRGIRTELPGCGN